MKHSAIVWIGLAAAAMAPAQAVPAELSALAAKARVTLPISSWCTGEFRSGQPGAFAVAVADAAGGGQYLVLHADGAAVALASYTRGADLSGYSRAEAERLNDTFGRSITIHGQLAPRWATTVVCAFVDATRAVCWQYSPAEESFVRVGEWIT